MGVLGVIPARFHATRLPGKPLADLEGRPLVVRVWDNVRRATSLDDVVVATDHPGIVAAVEAVGGRAVLTDPELASGSDRVAAAARSLDPEGTRFDVVVNIQGDEPFLPPDAIDRAVALLAGDDGAAIATLATPAADDDLDRPQAVKVVLDGGGRALYFSRAPIPFPFRDGPAARRAGPLRHLGLYVFRRSYLERFVSLPVSGLEAREGLEQLRALDDGARIAVAVGPWPAFGIDTPAELEEARRRLRAESATAG